MSISGRFDILFNMPKTTYPIHLYNIFTFSMIKIKAKIFMLMFKIHLVIFRVTSYYIRLDESNINLNLAFQEEELKAAAIAAGKDWEIEKLK